MLLGELTVDPEYVAMCKQAAAFQKRFQLYAETGKYLRWWDERFHEVRHMVIKSDEELATFGEFTSEFVFLPTIDQLLKFTVNPIEALETIERAVRHEKRNTLKYYTLLSSPEKRLLAIIMWRDVNVTWSQRDQTWVTPEWGGKNG